MPKRHISSSSLLAEHSRRPMSVVVYTESCVSKLVSAKHVVTLNIFPVPMIVYQTSGVSPASEHSGVPFEYVAVAVLLSTVIPSATIRQSFILKSHWLVGNIVTASLKLPTPPE